MDNDFATGYALGSDSGNTNNGSGMWGGDGSWIFAFLIIAATVRTAQDIRARLLAPICAVSSTSTTCPVPFSAFRTDCATAFTA